MFSLSRNITVNTTFSKSEKSTWNLYSHGGQYFPGLHDCDYLLHIKKTHQIMLYTV